MEYETKYVFNNCSAYKIVKWLTCTCQKDGDYPEGSVSSIYYDSADWAYMSEKINSDYLKTKIRVRWYGDIDNSFQYEHSFAEAKFKIGNYRKKIRIKIPYSGKWLTNIQLENPQLLQLTDVLKANGVRMNVNLVPTIHVHYKRLRFVDPYSGSRICLDYDISAPRVNGCMMARINPFSLHTGVFEIKGFTQELPVSLKALTFMGCKKTSFSKYQACFEKISGITF